MPESSPAIHIDGLTKRYVASAPPALDKLTLSVQKGEVYGFLGPNGAGKSTTIRLLLNFIQPTSGTAQILGQDIVNDTVPIKKSVGYLSGDFAAYSKMTGSQFLSYMSDLQPLKHPKYLKELSNLFKLDLSKKISSLSKGNRQKVGIIQALMHEPDILILDEPTDGLDPLMQEEFYRLVRESKQRGVTVFVSSHNLPEVRKMCDRVGIIKAGKLVSESTIAELATKAAQTFHISFKSKPPISQLKKLRGVKILSTPEHTAVIQVHDSLNPLFKLLAQHEVTALSSQELDLEEEFMRFYETEKV